jgi:4'-phosphopantetheinyl transferase EntD
MLQRILPAEVVAVETRVDPVEATLYPEEEAAVARAVAKRRAEFTSARHCARLALAGLGLPPAPIVPGLRGAPQWPAGVVGSMTHCAGYRAAALAHSRDIATIGVDAEPHEPLPAEVLPLVTLPAERDMLATLAVTEPQVHWDRLLFATKEAVYKAWFPLTRRWLGFEDAVVTIEPGRSGRFTARILTSAGAEPAAFTGEYLTTDDFVLAAIAVPATGSDALRR